MDQNIKTRLIIMNFLQFAIWGAYLTSMGNFLFNNNLADKIGLFYSTQGFVSLITPAIMGIIADKFIQAQKLLGINHFLSSLSMLMIFFSCNGNSNIEFVNVYPFYLIAIGLFMPTLALSNSVSYNALEKNGLDTIKSFPPIRIFGTIGFIVSMLIVDFSEFKENHYQFLISAIWGFCLAIYAFSLPKCEIKKDKESKTLAQALGLNAFSLFKQKKMALFFIFSMMLGVNLQITNGYAGNFISSFKSLPEFADAFFADHWNLLISLSQCSETLCILLIPFFLKKYGIKKIMMIAMFAWVLRFGFFIFGNPGFPGVTLLILSMIVYGVAFDFFNISGSLFVDKQVEKDSRSSAQGLFFLMTNGLGASIGMLIAQQVVNSYTIEGITNWQNVWIAFTSYAFVIFLLFSVLFKEK